MPTFQRQLKSILVLLSYEIAVKYIGKITKMVPKASISLITLKGISFNVIN